MPSLWPASSGSEMPVALVTGSSRGIGRAIALRLAHDGFDVVVNDLPSLSDKLRAVEREISGLGKKCLVAVADVTNEEEVKGMVEKTVTQLGGLDVMVANAGVFEMAPFVDHTVETFTGIFSVNVLGTFLCLKYASLKMIKQGRGGKLIAASSVAGKQGAHGSTAYNASKFAIRGIVQTAAIELGPHGITANAYAPGATDTDLPYSFSKHPSLDPSLALEEVKSKSLLHKIAQPEDIAATVSFLASPGGNFITGQTISVDGGWTLS